MKKTLIAAALAAFAASPVLAQQGPWAPQPLPLYPSGQVSMYAPGPYAAQGGFAVQQTNPQYYSGAAVSVDGKLIGQDPDPSIRSELERNADYYLGRGGD